ncbi:MAG: BglII/BstYI family type II restriction endonuclease [Dehalococcoidia bacterium]|jgi:hypothetical protein|nr:BglII/BstYI family type II restriction endonuclease [Dehalococcoidia bacterium]HJN87584.1 BglII/BstYI family type II restriction endonuclease [Dehalococcoidia bacterium]
MKYKITYLHCGEHLKESLKTEIQEVVQVVESIDWQDEFKVIQPRSTLFHQTAYNKRFELEFQQLGWETKPKLSLNPRLIGDFRKNLVFVEVQFGNSATLYRDFYKFQYGLQNGLLSLSVLIVPMNPKEFFPTRPRNISNMAEYDLALRYFTVLPISVPTMVIGLIAG